jgi:hypothetical protein
MTQFQLLDPRLEPYGHETNQQRIEALKKKSIVVPRPRDFRNPGLSIIVLNLDKPELVRQLWAGFMDVAKNFESLEINLELLVGDTGSTDPTTLELLQAPPENCRVFFDCKYHFSKLNNRLSDLTQYDTVLFLNNDVLISENSSSISDAYMYLSQNSRMAVIGAVLLFPDGTIQHEGINFLSSPENFGLPYHPNAHRLPDREYEVARDVLAVTGAFMMVRSAPFNNVGGFDEAFESECQDVDLCLKIARLGSTICVIDFGRLVHLENATRPKGHEDWKDRSLFLRRWSSYIEAQ